jgi:SAM-dependent methyltransferase
MNLSLDTIQIILVIILSILIANYLYLRWSLRAQRAAMEDIEGFINPDGSDGDTIILGNEHLYDEFYVKIYDQIVQGGQRTEAEVGLTLAFAKQYRPEVESLEVLDIGSGTGGHVQAFKAAGVGKIIGLDASEAMVAKARKTYPKNDYRVGTAERVGQFAASEFNLITLNYFTYYYLTDPVQMFRNTFQWLQPGGCLIIHLVNREKFDPILEAASPFHAFSIQKYSKERVTRSVIKFDKFEYEADFNLEGDYAEFREEFRFANGKLRRQIHKLRMPRMESVVKVAEENGFVYKQFIDLTAIGYEYQYLFCFTR